MHRPLLHGARHGGPELGKLFTQVGLGGFLQQLSLLGVGFGKAFVQGAQLLGAPGFAGLLGLGNAHLDLLAAGAVGGQVLLHFHPGAVAVLPGVLADEALLGQGIEIGRPLADHGQGGLELGHLFTHRGQLGLLCVDVSQQLAVVRLQIGPFGVKLLQEHGLTGRVVELLQHGQRGRLATAERFDQGLGAPGLRQRRHALFRHAPLVGACRRGVQFDQDLAGLDLVAVGHMDGSHHAGFQRLNLLGAIADHDAPLGHSHHIERTDAGPQHRNPSQRHDGVHGSARRRVRRCGLQAERRRQEGGLVGQSSGPVQLMAVGPHGGTDLAIPCQQLDERVARSGCRVDGAHAAPPGVGWPPSSCPPCCMRHR